MDEMAIMEVSWYTRQLKKMGQGKDPKPGESALKVFLLTVLDSIRGTRKVQRLRAASG